LIKPHDQRSGGHALDLFGTIAGVVAFHVAFGLPFAIFLLRNFFTGIPRDLVEAARMDGATEWVIFRRVVLPVAKPALASLAIFQFLWVWNDLLVALVFADQDSAPITVALRGQLRQFGSNINLLASGAFLSMVVPWRCFWRSSGTSCRECWPGPPSRTVVLGRDLAGRALFLTSARGVQYVVQSLSEANGVVQLVHG
jgi:hypothetical protein